MGWFQTIGQKVSGALGKGISIGRKVAHATESIAHKVAIGARAIGGGLDKAEAVSGAVRSGIERVKTIGGSGSLMDKMNAAKGLAGDVRAVKANLPSMRRRP